MRLAVFVVFAASVAYACSSELGRNTALSGSPDGGSDEENPTLNGEYTPLSPSDCVDLDDRGGEDCRPIGTCPGCAGGVRYRCNFAGPDWEQPTIADGGKLGGCAAIRPKSVVPGTTRTAKDYCCPAACVRFAETDGYCSDDRPHRYVCAGADAGAPGPECSWHGAGRALDEVSPVSYYCCK